MWRTEPHVYSSSQFLPVSRGALIAVYLNDRNRLVSAILRPQNPGKGSNQCLLPQEPIFCLETAIKMFYWASLVYRYNEAQNQQLSALPSNIREVLGQMELAMHCAFSCT